MQYKFPILFLTGGRMITPLATPLRLRCDLSFVIGNCMAHLQVTSDSIGLWSRLWAYIGQYLYFLLCCPSDINCGIRRWCAPSCRRLQIISLTHTLRLLLRNRLINSNAAARISVVFTAIEAIQISSSIAEI